VSVISSRGTQGLCPEVFVKMARRSRCLEAISMLLDSQTLISLGARFAPASPTLAILDRSGLLLKLEPNVGSSRRLKVDNEFGGCCAGSERLALQMVLVNLPL
jgi:hypothetical protein